VVYTYQTALDSMRKRSATWATLLSVGFPYARRNFSFESIVGYDRTTGPFDAAVRDVHKLAAL